MRTDAVKLRQVLINLLGNAVKFTAEGGVLLNVVHTTGPVDDARRRLCFTVTDTGPGIDATEQGQLFQAFTQTRVGLNAREGAGLGLVISRQFVQLLGGDITVTSQPGRGSCFSFELDLEVIATAEPVREGLELLHANEISGKVAAPLPETAGPERLRALPEALLRQLRHAVLHLDMQRTTELARQIIVIDPVLGAWLLSQIRELCYELVLRLLDSATDGAAAPAD